VSVKSEIKDGSGTGRAANVTSSNALLVSVLPQTSKGIPPNDLAALRQLREFFVDSVGSEDQRVDGSTSAVEFSVSAETGITRWVTGFRLIIQGQNTDMSSNDFRRYSATSGGLTNGVDIEAIQGGVTTAITGAGAVADMGQYLRYADDFLNIVSAISANVDYLHFDFTFDQPVVLTEGTSDRLLIRVNDDLTSAYNVPSADTAQFAVARGYQESV
jgi:hypothetical protein